jgi:UDP-N-acetylglucosamine 2-epimerase (non-hydrolysing)
VTDSARRVLIVIGTRPEGIKLAPVISALTARADDGIETRVALTGQHSTLMDQVLDVFGIPVEWDLDIMRDGQSLFDVTRDCLDGLRGVLDAYRPDLVVVQGDTASAFVGGLAGFLQRTRIAHVEAGLRSGDRWRPWPEEIFRRLTDVVTDMHLAPTPMAREHLLRENVEESSIHVTGNTVVDALLDIAKRPHEPQNEALAEVLRGDRRLILVTAHRRESFGEPLREAFGALRRLMEETTDCTLLYPVHPNPNVQAAAAVLQDHPRIVLTQPLDYLDLVLALKHATLVITDSGGIQEEAPTFGAPVLVMRDVTERPEAVMAGAAELVGTNATRILDASRRALANRAKREAGASPYGDGRAGDRIADIIAHALCGTPRRTQDWPGPE